MLLSLIALTFLFSWRTVANDTTCAFRYGRPSARDCVFAAVHLIPESDEPYDWVVYKNPPKPIVRLPLVFYFRKS